MPCNKAIRRCCICHAFYYYFFSRFSYILKKETFLWLDGSSPYLLAGVVEGRSWAQEYRFWVSTGLNSTYSIFVIQYRWSQYIFKKYLFNIIDLWGTTKSCTLKILRISLFKDGESSPTSLRSGSVVKGGALFKPSGGAHQVMTIKGAKKGPTGLQSSSNSPNSMLRFLVVISVLFGLISSQEPAVETPQDPPAVTTVVATAECAAQSDTTFELMTGYVFTSPAEILDTRPDTLQLADCIEFCRTNAACRALNFETGLCVLFKSNAVVSPGIYFFLLVMALGFTWACRHAWIEF